MAHFLYQHPTLPISSGYSSAKLCSWFRRASLWLRLWGFCRCTQAPSRRLALVRRWHSKSSTSPPPSTTPATRYMPVFATLLLSHIRRSHMSRPYGPWGEIHSCQCRFDSQRCAHCQTPGRPTKIFRLSVFPVSAARRALVAIAATVVCRWMYFRRCLFWRGSGASRPCASYSTTGLRVTPSCWWCASTRPRSRPGAPASPHRPPSISASTSPSSLTSSPPSR